MRSFYLVAWALLAFSGARAGQIPLALSSTTRWNLQDDNAASWDLDALPSSNNTSHLLYDTINSLLQHWPNTRYRNGHTLVPGTIPLGMLLYHGTSVPEVPKVPEWLATDPEHSYIFSLGKEDTGGWHFTFVTTRPLKILYFDGSSAAKVRGGALDSQDVLLWGKPIPEWTFNERKRIDGLCDWGRKLGLDGFARMEMDFEIMLCDFSDGLAVVSKLNLPPSMEELPLPPNNTFIVDLPQLMTTALESGWWHNQYPGDPRIELDLSRLVSFYDTSLVPSLVPVRHHQQRHEHRLEGISPTDVKTVREALALALNRTGSGSGINWRSIFRIITLRYADRLELIRYLLNPTELEPEIPRSLIETAKLVQQQLRISLTPYIINGAAPPMVDGDAGARNHSWTAPIFKYCATTHTNSFIASSSKLTPSEQLILTAIRDTNKEICRVIVKMWAEGVYEGLDPILRQPSSSDSESEPSPEALGSLMNRWRVEIDRLFNWLDWSIWIKCRPACGPEVRHSSVQNAADDPHSVLTL
ncbi:hypothetical protein H0H81_004414 [Sphagnurus paluster]|uniref:Uncharacterized protein n=1 Tax=Sphagnurus paluster TaxID=117069 RepID=A0A9P7GLZ2_9AGAR|nr:hypothetical protein H0H81_004414 [Sphagnurus paluster]